MALLRQTLQPGALAAPGESGQLLDERKGPRPLLLETVGGVGSIPPKTPSFFGGSSFLRTEQKSFCFFGSVESCDPRRETHSRYLLQVQRCL